MMQCGTMTAVLLLSLVICLVIHVARGFIVGDFDDGVPPLCILGILTLLFGVGAATMTEDGDISTYSGARQYANKHKDDEEKEKQNEKQSEKADAPADAVPSDIPPIDLRVCDVRV